MIRPGDVVGGVELRVDADKQRVLGWGYVFYYRVCDFHSALRQCELEGFIASVNIACLRSDPGKSGLMVAGPVDS
jgi:hypothetical protein